MKTYTEEEVADILKNIKNIAALTRPSKGLYGSDLKRHNEAFRRANKQIAALRDILTDVVAAHKALDEDAMTVAVRRAKRTLDRLPEQEAVRPPSIKRK